MTMLLKQLIESPMTSSRLLVWDPFREQDQEELVKEVIGLANADVDGPRNILFGINPGGIDGARTVGIADNAMADLKKAHRTISALIEPFLHLAFIFDRINGKLVGTLEIDGCDDRPYIIGQNFSETLSRGRCWVREGRNIRAVQPADLTLTDATEPAKEPSRIVQPPSISVGFNDDPECKLLELAIPDTSDPPFAEVKQQDQQPPDVKKTIKEKLGTATTQILPLVGAHKQGIAVSSQQRDNDNLSDECEVTEAVLAEANDHYFFEEKALQLNFSVCSNGAESIENVSIKLGFPRLPDFEVVDRLYVSPFDKRAKHQAGNRGYPKVERRDDGTIVRSSIGALAPDSSQQVFKCALRLAAGPRLQKKKIAVLYTLYGPDKEVLDKGRLKIRFGQVPA